ncbi:hypothetical protein V8E36_001052 [Tilletia maclaganii]
MSRLIAWAQRSTLLGPFRFPAEAIQVDHAALHRSRGVFTLTHQDANAVTRMNGVVLREGQSGVLDDGTEIELGFLCPYTGEFESRFSLQARLDDSLCDEAQEQLQQERDQAARARDAALQDQEERINRKYGAGRPYGKLVEDLQAFSANTSQEGVTSSSITAAENAGNLHALQIRPARLTASTISIPSNSSLCSADRASSRQPASSASNRALSTNSAISASTSPSPSQSSPTLSTPSSSLPGSDFPTSTTSVSASPSRDDDSKAQPTAPALSSSSYDRALRRVRKAWIEARAAVLAASQSRSRGSCRSSLDVTIDRVGAALNAARSRLATISTQPRPSSSCASAAGGHSILDRIRLDVARAACESLARAATALLASLPVYGCNTSSARLPPARFRPLRASRAR